MKDLGPLSYFLGWEVYQILRGVFLNIKYIQYLIELINMTKTSSIDTPMEGNLKLRNDEGNLLSDPTLYRRLVACLIYLSFTRLDISYAVNIVSQFMASLCHLHLAVVHRIIRYLKGILDYGLFFP